jgi:TetR/AcrR family transcriptional repressor of mexJK operon
MNRQQAVAKFAERQPTKKEQEVLNVAADYFLSHGYKGTSINAMARDSGISKESIYRYFSSKKELFEAVIAKELTEYKDKLQFLNFEYDSIAMDEALKRAAESILGAVTADVTLALRRLIFQETVTAPDIGEFYYEIGPQVAYKNLEKIFEAHQAETDFNPQKLTHYFVAMILHRVMIQRDCGVREPLAENEVKDLANEVTDDFLKAFFK